MKDYIVFDTETGGLNPKNTDLLQVGMIFIKGNKIVEKCEFNVKQDIYRVTPDALKLNKIDLIEHNQQKNLMSKESIGYAITNLKNKIYNNKKIPVLGHNVNFDLNFIYENILSKDKWEELFSYRNVDTAGISRFLIDAGKLPGLYKNDLSSLMVYFNLGSELSENRHTALFDAECTMTIYNKFLELIKEGK